jgi:hypothetical protein
MKVACCVWRGAFGTGLLQQYLAGCLPYLNEALLQYCEAEQITFTRGRPDLKADQCFVEQKNGAVVRQFVGFDRLTGEQAYRQLRELYRAVRLYVNCFQPSMKLLSKYPSGEKVRRVYDPAKTPLQRLLLSGILPADRQQELGEVGKTLDPPEPPSSPGTLATRPVALCGLRFSAHVKRSRRIPPALFHRALPAGNSCLSGEGTCSGFGAPKAAERTASRDRHVGLATDRQRSF